MITIYIPFESLKEAALSNISQSDWLFLAEKLWLFEEFPCLDSTRFHIGFEK